MRIGLNTRGTTNTGGLATALRLDGKMRISSSLLPQHALCQKWGSRGLGQRREFMGMSKQKEMDLDCGNSVSQPYFIIFLGN